MCTMLRELELTEVEPLVYLYPEVSSSSQSIVHTPDLPTKYQHVMNLSHKFGPTLRHFGLTLLLLQIYFLKKFLEMYPSNISNERS